MRGLGSYCLAGFMLLGAPALAAQFEPPKGCSGVVTVQFNGCLMLNVWQCETDVVGEQWMGLFSDQGLRRVRKIDSEFQWLETYHVRTGLVERIVTPAPDPENLSELIETGVDSYDFTIVESGPSAGPDLRYKGYDRLTGEQTVIDGEVLLNTEFGYDAVTPDGTVNHAREGAQFVHPKYRLFLFGTSQNPDGSNPNDNRPISFAKPGDADFFPALPTVGCGAILS